MQAAGLPVLAFKYDSIYELIQPGFNGDLFENEGELSDLIYEMIRNPDKV